MRRLLPTFVLAATTALSPLALPATTADAATATVDGPDVASYQHPNGVAIDWAAVKRSGRSFAFVKATEGAAYTNPYFGRDWAGIKAVGLVRGSYHYARPAWPVSTAVDQAKRYIGVTGSTREKGDLPPALDLEEDGGLSQGQLVTWAQVWLDTVHNLTGRTPIIYTYRWFWQAKLADSDAMTRYPLWLAQYGATSPSLPLIGSWPSWTFWQYTSTASVPGLPGGVDMSRFNGSATEMWALADGTALQPWVVRGPSAPEHVTATASSTADATAVVTWVPGDNGGSLVRSFTITASPGGETVTVDGYTTRAVISGLHDGTAYTFTVRAANGSGTSPASAPSGSATPLRPTSIVSALTPTVLRTGGTAAMTARLTRADTGQPLPGRSLVVYGRYHGTSAWTRVATVTTDSNGVGRYAWRPTRNTDVEMEWIPDPGWQGRVSYVRTVSVVPILQGRLSATAMLPDRQVALYGRVIPNHPGALVQRQAYYNGGWHVWEQGRIAADGTYRFVMRPTHRATYVFRVYVPATPSFAAAATPAMTLHVL